MTHICNRCTKDVETCDGKPYFEGKIALCNEANLKPKNTGLCEDCDNDDCELMFSDQVIEDCDDYIDFMEDDDSETED